MNDVIYRNMSNEVEDVPMLKAKRGFDPLFEALWRSCSVRNNVVWRSSHLPSENLGIDPSDDRVQSSSGQFQTGHKKQATYMLSVRGPLAHMEYQLACFDDRILTNSGNLP